MFIRGAHRNAGEPRTARSRFRTRRSKTLIAVVLLICLAVGTPTAMAASAKSVPTMVAMGDSFTSGTGNMPSGEGSELCRRSTSAYPHVAAATLSMRVHNLACSGAKAGGMAAPFKGEASQIESLRSLAATNNVRHVVLTIGGNDVDGYQAFRKQLFGLPTPEFDAAVNELPAQIAETVRAVRLAAPRAKVYVMTYPNIFPTTKAEVAGCVGKLLAQGVRPEIWGAQMTALNGAVNTGAMNLNDPRVRVVNQQSFAGHDVCSSDPWAFRFAGEAGTREGALHPNAIGHQKMAESLVQEIRR